MIAFLADEDFDAGIVRGLRRRAGEYGLPPIDIVSVQEVGLASSPDPAVLEWAAKDGRVVLTHDVNTMRAHAYERLRSGQSVVGVVIVKRSREFGRILDDILTIAHCSNPRDWVDPVYHVPL